MRSSENVIVLGKEVDGLSKQLTIETIDSEESLEIGVVGNEEYGKFFSKSISEGRESN